MLSLLAAQRMPSLFSSLGGNSVAVRRSTSVMLDIHSVTCE